MRITLKQVNDALRAAGKAEQLVKGAGYFYFAEGNAPRWLNSSVAVQNLNELTLEQWLEAHSKLEKQYEERYRT